MHNIITNDLLKIAIDPFKLRLYCIMQGFWQYHADKAEHVHSIFQQLSQQFGIHSVVLDTSAMKIMQPRVAEHFLPLFTDYLLDSEIKALAHVGSPNNTILRLQFRRVLNSVQRSNEVRHETFQQMQDAEQWLDTL